MKKILLLLAFVVAACLFLSACGENEAPPSAKVSDTAPASAPPPAVTASPAGEGDKNDYIHIDDVHAYLQDFYSYEIEEAGKYRVKDGDTEYYFDTSKVIEMDVAPEFPLYRIKDKDSWPEYLGTTGYAFQARGQYIYVESELLSEDSPGYGITRIVDLNDLSIISIGRNVSIFFPEKGKNIYYTQDDIESIFIADPSAWNPKELRVNIPDKKAVEENVEKLIDYNISELLTDIDITGAADGWINFGYWLYEFEGPAFYYGNYRIKTDGSKIEKIGEGQFGDEIGFEES